ncbi:histone deacetylase complex protein [Rickenella mellea]|uniref:histone deacetylase n=1 Tax=Rickenella mellea TaxID=50990 RepID=A0A4Y7Q3I5_9AGAM|nr:histone deacetylase complex protein [Rickenella mellea]
MDIDRRSTHDDHKFNYSTTLISGKSGVGSVATIDVPKSSPSPSARAASNTSRPYVEINTERATSTLATRTTSDLGSFGYVYDSRMLLHSSRSDHPESPDRIRKIYERLKDENILARIKRIPARKAKKSEVLLVHSEDHWDNVESIASMSNDAMIDAEAYYSYLSLYVSPSTPMAAKLACGGVIEAALSVATGDLKRAFAIVRPPGHHAEPEEHMGYCFFNNVSVAAKVVQQLTSLKKILIFDWDVHHGNGTQRAFIDDPSVLYVSIHRYDGGAFYPCGPFGGLTSCGEGLGLGTSVNIPWPEKGMGDADYIHAFSKIVMPIAMEFSPELVIITAGFDAADGDDHGDCHVTPAGYAHMTHMLATLAGGRLIAALEGGYNISNISSFALEVVRTMIGEAPPELAPMVASEVATETVWQVAMQQSRFWKSVDPKGCEPSEDVEEHMMSIPDILKAHRQELLHQEYSMLQVPYLDPELDERFNAQVLISDDMLQHETVVVFVHQLGDIRADLEGSMMCNMNIEYSHLVSLLLFLRDNTVASKLLQVDVTHDLFQWIRSQNYSLVEVNTHSRRPKLSNQIHSTGALTLELMTYVWDNYIQISGAKHVLLVGHGRGCEAMVELIDKRQRNIMKKVRAVVQVVGNTNIPHLPRGLDETFIHWYKENSFVAAPQQHRIFTDANKVVKRLGHVERFDEENPSKLLSIALPHIQEFVNTRLESEGHPYCLI